MFIIHFCLVKQPEETFMELLEISSEQCLKEKCKKNFSVRKTFNTFIPIISSTFVGSKGGLACDSLLAFPIFPERLWVANMLDPKTATAKSLIMADHDVPPLPHAWNVSFARFSFVDFNLYNTHLIIN